MMKKSCKKAVETILYHLSQYPLIHHDLNSVLDMKTTQLWCYRIVVYSSTLSNLRMGKTATTCSLHFPCITVLVLYNEL